MSADYQFVGSPLQETDLLQRAMMISPEYHRQVVTRAIVGAMENSPADRCCIVGAGHCQDLNLQSLLSAFREVHLVDIDTSSIEHGIHRQQVAQSARIHAHGGFDVTGVHQLLIECSQMSDPARVDLEALHRQIKEFNWNALGAGFDVVASTCMFSQVVQHVLDTLGPMGEAVYVPIIQALRLRHLELVVAACRPGGVGLLFTDVVSSDTLPEIPSKAGAGLQPLLNRAISEQNFFTGLNPVILQGLFESEPSLKGEIESVTTSHPWVWNAGTRYYVVVAFRFKRRKEEPRS
ncbi:MAG TPA: hypothetical protein PKD54_05770 [Pirellulaceae bacterium]|nr:hypothetical protein [Pirellulaceae bacterium]